MDTDRETKNFRLMCLMSEFLNKYADRFTADDVQSIADACGVGTAYAYSVLAAAVCGLDIENSGDDRELFFDYFPEMFHEVSAAECRENPYFKNIVLPDVRIGRCELAHKRMKSFEAFAADDTRMLEDGRLMPNIGFLDSELDYPCILEDGRIWMTVTPLEIATMRDAAARARGRVLTFGLGLGYFAYMASEKPGVESVTAVDCSENTIELFEKYILPQFGHPEKIRLIHDDAFAYAEKRMAGEKYDFVFADTWHDVADGTDMYLRMKKFEPLLHDAEFAYWIEPSLLCHIKLTGAGHDSEE